MPFAIENPYAGANRPRTIRFTDELYEELEQTAKRHKVSFNMLVLQCCRYALDEMDGGDAAKE